MRSNSDRNKKMKTTKHRIHILIVYCNFQCSFHIHTRECETSFCNRKCIFIYYANNKCIRTGCTMSNERIALVARHLQC